MLDAAAFYQDGKVALLSRMRDLESACCLEVVTYSDLQRQEVDVLGEAIRGGNTVLQVAGCDKGADPCVLSQPPSPLALPAL